MKKSPLKLASLILASLIFFVSALASEPGVSTPPVKDDGQAWYVQSLGVSVLSFLTDPEVEDTNIDSEDLCFLGEVGSAELELIELVNEGLLYSDSESALYQGSIAGDQTNSIAVELYSSKLQDDCADCTGEYDIELKDCQNIEKSEEQVELELKLKNLMTDEDYEGEFDDHLCMEAIYDEDGEEMVDFLIENRSFDAALESLGMTWDLEGIYGDYTAMIEIYTVDLETGDNDDYVGGVAMNFCE